jgi:hypothetical protein
MRRVTEASLRFAERRRREDEAQRLSQVAPDLVSLKLEIEERRDGTGTGAPRHVRHIVVENAPALFIVPCGESSCKDGGYDVTDTVLRALRGHQNQFEAENTCNGSVGSAQCSRTLHLSATATYR